MKNASVINFDYVLEDETPIYVRIDVYSPNDFELTYAALGDSPKIQISSADSERIFDEASNLVCNYFAREADFLYDQWKDETVTG